MADDFDRVADGLDPANLDLERLMTRIVITVAGGSKRATPVKTGNLKRSETHRVERAGERGLVGTNVSYAPAVHARVPFFTRGLAASRATIDQLLRAAGQDYLRSVVR